MSQVPAGRYPIRPTQRDLQELKESILGVATPETLDTLQEIAAALGNDPNYFTTIADQVSELNTDVTDVVSALGITENDSDVGTFTSPTLPDGTTLRAVLEAFAGAYDITKSNLEDADGLLQGRLDVLETDPTTQTVVDALETALDGRLDVLEADPTTQTAVDLKANLAGPIFTGDVTLGNGAFYDESSERMGFGTSTPGGRLHVYDTGGVQAIFQRTGGSSTLTVKNNPGDTGITLQSTSQTADALRWEGYGTGAGFSFDINDGGTVTRKLQVQNDAVTVNTQLIGSALVNAANDGDAASSGVPVGGLYHHNGDMKLRVS